MADHSTMEAAYLAAIREFLQEYELPAEAQQTEVVSTSSHRSKPKAVDRRTRYRNKLNDERATLKRQERELSTALLKLQKAKAERIEREKKSYSLSLAVWRSAALRQREKRLEAEELQRQLNATVDNQAETICQMKTLMMQLHTSRPPTKLEMQPQVDGSLLYQTFLREIDSVFAKTEQVMNAVEFKRSPPENYSIVRHWNRTNTLLEGANATALPFGFEQTWRAMSFVLLCDPSGCHYDGDVEDPENTAAMTYRVNYTLDSGESAPLVIYTVTRRYVEADRVVFVWRVLNEGKGEYDGLYADEHAWLVIRPSVDEAGKPETILESFTRLTPATFERHPLKDDNSRESRFMKTLAKADEQDLNAIGVALEQLLVHGPQSKADSHLNTQDVVLELAL